MNRLRLLIFSILSTTLLQAQTLQWNTNPASLTPIRATVNGFNTGPAFNEIFEASSSPQLLNDRCGLFFNDHKALSMTPQPNLVAKTAELAPKILRFPKGTMSNYYHLYQYNANGSYDHNNPVFIKGFGTQEKETRVYGGGNSIRQQYCKVDNTVKIEVLM